MRMKTYAVIVVIAWLVTLTVIIHNQVTRHQNQSKAKPSKESVLK